MNYKRNFAKNMETRLGRWLIFSNVVSGWNRAIYSLIALGFVFNGTKVTNFANGEFVMIRGAVERLAGKRAPDCQLLAIPGAVVVW
jgi:branched-subunit amino acid ABC-type transport system permease component